MNSWREEELFIRPLVRMDHEAFVQLMAAAFAHDPLITLLSSPAARKGWSRSRGMKLSEPIFSFMFYKGFLPHHEGWGIFQGSTLLGAYIVENPRGRLNNKVTFPLYTLVHLTGAITRLCLTLPIRSLRRATEYIRLIQDQAPAEPHHYLNLLGVHPSTQGRGLSRQLLNHLLSRASRSPGSSGIALDTENTRNIAIYEKLGFQLTHTAKLQETPVYCMFLKFNQ